MKCGSDLFVGSGKQQKWTCHLVVAIHKNFGRQMFFESINIDSCIVLNWLNWEDAAHNCWMLLTRTHWPTWFQFSIYFFPHHSVTESIQSASTSYRNSLRFILWLTYGCCLTMNGRTEIHRTVDCLILPFGMLWLNRKKLTIFISFICPNSLSLTKLYPNGTTHYWEKKNRLAQPDEQNVEEFGSVSFCHASITQFHVLSLPLAVLHTVPMLRRYFIRFHSVWCFVHSTKIFCLSAEVGLISDDQTRADTIMSLFWSARNRLNIVDWCGFFSVVFRLSSLARTKAISFLKILEECC